MSRQAMCVACGPGGTSPIKISSALYKVEYIWGIGSDEITVQLCPSEQRPRAKASADPRQSPSGDSSRGSQILPAPSTQLLMREYSGMAQAGTRSSDS